MKEGDVVMMRGDGPIMTVVHDAEKTGADEVMVVRCVWFNKNDELQASDFKVSLLVKVPYT